MPAFQYVRGFSAAAAPQPARVSNLPAPGMQRLDWRAVFSPSTVAALRQCAESGQAVQAIAPLPLPRSAGY